MINSISNINSYNLYPTRSLRNKNTQPSAQVSFQSKHLATIPLAAAATLFPMACIKNPFEEYFDSIGQIQTFVYNDKTPIYNPEFDAYIEKLNNLDDKEKKQFVKIFCERTGFPNLEKVQKNMDDEIKRAIEVCFQDSDAKPLFAGYASCCSVGRATALPGSDCDGLFIVSDKSSGKNIPYRWNIGNEINQRILETQGEHYPELFAIDELIPYIQMADEIFEEIKTPEKVKNYKQNLMRKDHDFVTAGEFNIDIASKITNIHDKNMVYLTSMFVELVRSGHVLINNLDEDLLQKIQSSSLYKYSNIMRQEGFKNNIKPKWANRIKMASEFSSKSDDEKFEICSEILKSSMGKHQHNPDNIYELFDMGNINEFNDKIRDWRYS